jgi:hypothetical protein
MTPEELSVTIADVVQDHLSLSMAPLLSDVKALQVQLSGWEARWNDLGLLRERVAVVEAKSAIPIEETDPVDLTPVLERVSAAEARLSVLGDLRDRVVTIETKAVPGVADVESINGRLVSLESDVRVMFSRVKDYDAGNTPIGERIAATEAKLDTLGDLRDRVVVVETKASSVVPVDLTDVRDKLAAVESELRTLPVVTPADYGLVLEKFDTLTKEVNALRERVAIAEMREMVPGPMGRDGQPGRDGKDGKDGVDGLGYDDLGIEQQPDIRSVKFLAKRGLQVRELGTLTIPVEMYRGVYVDGKTYDRGDGVTWGGSEWHCNETTATKPGDGSKAWTLKVKRGRDGKDGRDVQALPVVAVGRSK